MKVPKADVVLVGRELEDVRIYEKVFSPDERFSTVSLKDHASANNYNTWDITPDCVVIDSPFRHGYTSLLCGKIRNWFGKSAKIIVLIPQGQEYGFSRQAVDRFLRRPTTDEEREAFADTLREAARELMKRELEECPAEA